MKIENITQNVTLTANLIYVIPGTLRNIKYHTFTKEDFFYKI